MSAMAPHPLLVAALLFVGVHALDDPPDPGTGSSRSRAYLHVTTPFDEAELTRLVSPMSR